jgi:hypothetical protein
LLYLKGHVFMSETASGAGQKSQESGIQSVPDAQGTTQAHTPEVCTVCGDDFDPDADHHRGQCEERAAAEGMTPGPWTAGIAPYVKSDGDGDQFSGGDWNVFPPLGESGPVAIASSEANARLIAAAPDLLEAAQWVLHVSHGVGRAGEAPEPGEERAAYDALMAAAAKAEGR